jgi:hypothetical protein
METYRRRVRLRSRVSMIACEGELPYRRAERALELKGKTSVRITTSPRGRMSRGLHAKMTHFEISVADLDAAVAEVTAASGQAPNQPADRDQARGRVMLNPAGHRFCLHSE